MVVRNSGIIWVGDEVEVLLIKLLCFYGVGVVVESFVVLEDKFKVVVIEYNGICFNGNN